MDKNLKKKESKKAYTPPVPFFNAFFLTKCLFLTEISKSSVKKKAHPVYNMLDNF